MKALVVDDSSGMRTFLRLILKRAGIEVEEATNGVDALAVLCQGAAADFALLDWNMPEMDGFELLTAIRAERKFDGMRILMVTTETEMAQMTKALSAGANEYIMKPFTRDIVLDKLQLMGLLGN